MIYYLRIFKMITSLPQAEMNFIGNTLFDYQLKWAVCTDSDKVEHELFRGLLHSTSVQLMEAAIDVAERNIRQLETRAQCLENIA